MKVITEVYNVFSFDELSKEAQEKAIEKLYDINVDIDWWESIYEDANTIGLEITGFDLDRGSYCHGKFTESPETVIKLIKENHGKNTKTYKNAMQYKKELKKTKSDGDYESVRDEFLRSLLEDYRIFLQKDYEYLTSEEAIIETIKCNEYTFLENGTMKNS